MPASNLTSLAKGGPCDSWILKESPSAQSVSPLTARWAF